MPTGSIAFLPGVAHSVVHLENSRINVAENVISNQLEGPYGSELQQLMHYCSLGALVDSKEQYDAPQCEPETREAITQQVDDWGRNRDGKSAPVMWLRGGAGAGKSTLAQTIAMIYKREGILVGSFFFSNRRANRSDGSAMILTLVFQLLVTFPAVAPFIFQVIKRNPAILNSSPQEHMKHLFVGPLNAMNAVEPSSFSPYLQQLLFCLMFVLQSLLGPILGNLPYGHHIFLAPSSAKPKPCLIVIDGLDECNDPAIQCQLLRIIATAIPQLSQPLRFLVASRPEAHITRTFKQDNAFSAFAVQQLDLSADRDADADIERFLRRRFAAMRCSHPFGKHLTREWPSMSDIQTLVRRSSGHFIYPSTVMAFIEDPTDFPQHLFEAVLDPSKYTPPSDPFAPLNELYSVIFSRVKQRDLPVIQLFFGVLYLQNHHPWEVNKLLNDLSPFEQLHERLYMDGILQLPKGCLDVILQPLRSLLRIPDYPDDDEAPNNPDFNSKDTHPRHSGNSTDDNNSKLSPSYHLAASLENFRILHATLWDFLLDPARSNSYCIDLGWVHEEIAKLYINRIFNHRFPSPPSFSSNYRSFNNFVAHCKNSTISDPFIPLYLRTYDFLYDILIPSISTLDIDSKSGFSSLSKVLATILEFLDLVCRKDIDSTSQFRLYHVHRISKTLSANLHPPIQTLDIVQSVESRYAKAPTR
ncbi:hypothetical protein CPB83DRAFT_692236 [Crepidotus variabilis]|uniref:Nephrocystin 3-like N-terminal domain-containing protein n=1 Tax=Crepidotus variabilis TaxID=179855 RepID=A0A9P6E6E0_9AGAR|nr:hypothetical protein CPB83DRAFT_692236 [Crepidotus variabilis]